MEMKDIEHGGAAYIEDTVKILLDSKEQRPDFGNQRLPSIQMVPKGFRDLSLSSFDPRLVSIGPLHSKDENLQGFEGRKVAYLHDLLGRLGSQSKQALQACVEKVSGSIDRIKACYVGMPAYTDAELTKMMVTDGCFILEFINRFSKRDETLRKSLLITQSILYDLLLIENQIPFFVLEDIFECTILKLGLATSLTNHIKVLLIYYIVFDVKLEINDDEEATYDHILGLVHKSFCPPKGTPLNPGPVPQGHSAMELDRSGVNFTATKDKTWVMGIKLELPRFSCFPWFWCKPTLKIPVLYIHDFTDLILRNLITYEQCFLSQNYVTSYACAMDMLIDTPEDVARLAKSKVLVNTIGSNESAAIMINNLCKDVPIMGFFYHQEWQKLDKYYNGYWPNLAAGLKRTYFSSPWNIIALFAGIVLFVLTVVQTIFTIKAA